LAISGSSATGNTGLAGASESARQAKLKEEDAKKRALGVSDYTKYYFKGLTGLRGIDPELADQWMHTHSEQTEDAKKKAGLPADFKINDYYSSVEDGTADPETQAKVSTFESLLDNRFKNSILEESKNQTIQNLYNHGNLTEDQWNDLDNLVARTAIEENVDMESDRQDKEWNALPIATDHAKMTKRSLRDEAKSYLNDSRSEEGINAFTEDILHNPMATEETVKNFDELASALNTDYDIANNPENYKFLQDYSKLKDTECLKLTDAEKVRLSVTYQDNAYRGGQKYANEQLVNYFKDKMEENQTVLDATLNAGNQFIDSAASMLIGVAGVADGVLTGGQLSKLLDTEEGRKRREGQGYFQGIFDNALVEYSNDLMETHVYDRADQQKMKELGISDNSIYQTAEEEQQLLSTKTPLTLFGQYGFTTAFTGATMGMGAMANGTIKGGLWALKSMGAAKNAATYNKILRGAAKLKTALNTTNAAIVATAEGAQITQQDKEENYNHMVQDMENRYIKQTVDANPMLAASLLEQQAQSDSDLRSIPDGTLVQGKDGNTYRTFNGKDKQRIAELIQQNEVLRQQVVAAYEKAHPQEV